MLFVACTTPATIEIAVFAVLLTAAFAVSSMASLVVFMANSLISMTELFSALTPISVTVILPLSVRAS